MACYDLFPIKGKEKTPKIGWHTYLETICGIDDPNHRPSPKWLPMVSAIFFMNGRWDRQAFECPVCRGESISHHGESVLFVRKPHWEDDLDILIEKTNMALQDGLGGCGAGRCLIQAKAINTTHTGLIDWSWFAKTKIK